MLKQKSSYIHPAHIAYRPDIDGLRAIAVLVVIAFHAFPEKIKGGFIGVDIFFVISGFLISSIIFQDLGNNRFNIVEFYIRRVRRIFPSLILVLIFSFVLGWFTLLQDEYQQLGKHIAAGASFISNFVLWKEVGYFDNATETKPLLHLWSLGIEEQFYLLWPVVALLAWKRSFNLLTIILVVWISSFVLNVEYASSNRVLAFFSPQTRFWELFSGAIIAWFATLRPKAHQKYEKCLNRWLVRIIYSQKNDSENITLANTRATLGALLLMTGLLTINRESAFPGWWALLPISGTVLLITAGMQAWINRTILSNQNLVWIGLLSFPLYLWHWPLLSFTRIIFSETPPPLVRGGIILLSFLFAWLTYHLVEKPFRFGEHKKAKLIILIGLLTSIGYLGLDTDRRQGLPFRSAVVNHKINSDLLQWDSYQSPGCAKELGIQANFCIKFGAQNNIKVAIVGDSTGNSMAPGLGAELAQKGMGLINIGGWTCPPVKGLIETKHWGKINRCPEIIERTYQYLSRNKNIDTVIFAIFASDLKYWDIPGVPFDGSVEQKFAALMPLINLSVQELKGMNKNVIVTYDAPYSNLAARDCMPRPGLGRIASACKISINELPDRHPNIDLFHTFFKDRKDVCIFSQADLLIKQGYLNFVDQNGYLLLRDTHHLSLLGSHKMAEKLVNSECLAMDKLTTPRE